MPVSTAEKTLPTALSHLEKEYVKELGKYLEEVRPFWSEKFGLGGTLTNLESGTAWFTTLGNSSLESGCVSLQSKTYKVLTGHKPANWEISKIVLGSILEHHSVVVYGEGTKMTSGYLFDPWVDQKPLIFTFHEWVGRFPHYNIIKGPRLE